MSNQFDQQPEMPKLSFCEMCKKYFEDEQHQHKTYCIKEIEENIWRQFRQCQKQKLNRRQKSRMKQNVEKRLLKLYEDFAINFKDLIEKKMKKKKKLQEKLEKKKQQEQQQEEEQQQQQKEQQQQQQQQQQQKVQQPEQRQKKIDQYFPKIYMKKVNVSMEKYQCLICEKMYDSQQDLKRHVKQKHTEQVPQQPKDANKEQALVPDNKKSD